MESNGATIARAATTAFVERERVEGTVAFRVVDGSVQIDSIFETHCLAEILTTHSLFVDDPRALIALSIRSLAPSKLQSPFFAFLAVYHPFDQSLLWLFLPFSSARIARVLCHESGSFPSLPDA